MVKHGKQTPFMLKYGSQMVSVIFFYNYVIHLLRKSYRQMKTKMSVAVYKKGDLGKTAYHRGKRYRNTVKSLRCSILRKQLTAFSRELFSQNAPSQIFDRVLITLLLGITLNLIATIIYNAMLLHRLRTHIDSVLRRNQNGFLQNRSTSGQIINIIRIAEIAKAKHLEISSCIWTNFMNTSKIS